MANLNTCVSFNIPDLIMHGFFFIASIAELIRDQNIL